MIKPYEGNEIFQLFAFSKGRATSLSFLFGKPNSGRPGAGRQNRRPLRRTAEEIKGQSRRSQRDLPGGEAILSVKGGQKKGCRVERRNGGTARAGNFRNNP